MTSRPSATTAVILAAGMGTRLRSVHAERPKGFVAIGDQAIIARSLALLEASGVAQIVLVAGWHDEVYREFLARAFPSVQVVVNADFADTGSLASLVLGAVNVKGDVLVVESDLLYEARALSALFASPDRDTLLASGLTQSGDEVWVYSETERLAHLSKQAWGNASQRTELVGLTRLSAESLRALIDVAPRLPRGAHYEDGLNAICRDHAIRVLRVEDLAWCEIDSAEHLARARDVIWSRIQQRDRSAQPISP